MAKKKNPKPLAIRGSRVLTVDQALMRLHTARKTVGGDACLILSLTGSGIEMVNVEDLATIKDKESRYVEVRATHNAVNWLVECAEKKEGGTTVGGALIMAGNPVDGWTLTGLFSDKPTAIKYAEDQKLEEWHVVDVEKP